MPPIEFGGDMNDNVNKYDASWKDVPYKFETGTPPIAEVIGLGKAIEYLQSIGMENIHAYEQDLRQYVIAKLEQIDGITIHNKTAETGVISFNLDGVHPHDAVTFFDQENVCMRAGHHCAQLVIKWLEVAATLRASFYLYNTEKDADIFIDAVQKARHFFTEMGF
jgi:cysteine desulfurase/selenocysteine lyase